MNKKTRTQKYKKLQKKRTRKYKKHSKQLKTRKLRKNNMPIINTKGGVKTVHVGDPSRSSRSSRVRNKTKQNISTTNPERTNIINARKNFQTYIASIKKYLTNNKIKAKVFNVVEIEKTRRDAVIYLNKHGPESGLTAPETTTMWKNKLYEAQTTFAPVEIAEQELASELAEQKKTSDRQWKEKNARIKHAIDHDPVATRRSPAYVHFVLNNLDKMKPKVRIKYEKILKKLSNPVVRRFWESRRGKNMDPDTRAVFKVMYPEIKFDEEGLLVPALNKSKT